MATNSIKLLTGNSHPQLAKLVADRYVWPLNWETAGQGIWLMAHLQIGHRTCKDDESELFKPGDERHHW